MAATKQSPRAFGPAAQARRERREAKAARFKEAAAEAAVTTWSPHVSESGRDLIDAATDEALGTTSEQAKVRAAVRARDPHAMQEAGTALAAKKAELRRPTPAAQQPNRRPSVRSWLERMTPEERAAVELSDTFRNLSPDAQANILRVRDDVDEIDDAAELRLASEREEQLLEAEPEPEPEPLALDWDETMTLSEALGLDEEVEYAPSLSEEVGWPEEVE